MKSVKNSVKPCLNHKVYIFPPYNPGSKGNKYKQLLWECFAANNEFTIINRKIFKKTIFDFFFNIDADIFLFSWIESFTTSFARLIRFVHIILFIVILRLLGKKVVWILHNKHPHSSKTISSTIGMRILAMLSSKVITHAKEGISYFENNLKGKKGKCSYIPHPVYNTNIYTPGILKWDYIIWGGISKRKGIVEFLEYAQKDSFFLDKKILLCGMCKDCSYAKQITHYCGNNVTFVNAFITDRELREYIGSSKAILFTYHASSILSSGALVYSLNYCKPIIAPRVGAFMDMQGIVSCYDVFEDIPKIKLSLDKDKVLDYITSNTWQQFPAKLLGVLMN